MTDVLEFIFRDFWTWLGTMLLLFMATRWTPFHFHPSLKVNSPESSTDNSTNNRVEN